MSEVILAASQCRTSVTESYQTNNAASLPTAGNWGCESSTNTTKYVTSIQTDGAGAINVVVNNANLPQVVGSVRLVPSIATDAGGAKSIIGWLCGPSTTGIAKYLPGSCRDLSVSTYTAVGSWAP
jgi:type IV pilus assembly protein PilA